MIKFERKLSEKFHIKSTLSSLYVAVQWSNGLFCNDYAKFKSFIHSNVNLSEIQRDFLKNIH